MPDYSALMADWQALLARRPALGEPLRFWTAILEGWAAWKPPASLVPLGWSADECRGRWERGVSLLAEARPVIPSASVEELLGPVMERLAADGPEAVEAFQRLALAWDEGQIGASALLPAPDRDPAAWLLDRFGLGAHLGAFLPVTALRPALEIYFDGVRALPDGVWTRGSCPWCGGAAAYADLLGGRRPPPSRHLCGGAAVGVGVAWPGYIVAAVAAIGSLAGRRDQLAWVALLLTQAGFICHTGAVILRGIELRRLPVSTLAEMVSLLIWAVILLDFWVERQQRIRPLSAFLLPVVLSLRLGLPTV